MIAFIIGFLISLYALKTFLKQKNIVKQEKINEKNRKRAEASAVAQKKYINSKKESFNNIVDSLVKHNVVLDDSIVLCRKQLRDMHELKFKSITRAFEPDMLPAFIVVDVETTGLSATHDRIIEVSAILFEDFTPVSYFSTLVNPKRTIPNEVSIINNIYDSDVATAPSLEQISNSLLEFVGNCPVVGFNLAFDLKFLYCAGIDLFSKRKCYDAYLISKKAYADYLSSFSLVDVAAYNDIYFDAHNSLNDCLATGLVFEKAIKEIIS